MIPSKSIDNKSFRDICTYKNSDAIKFYIIFLLLEVPKQPERLFVFPVAESHIQCIS